ncbi:MAG: mtaD [Gammaproteobacteria bacterium]|jgi:5-methylthioadenosine/S-adenosylhomocysteine deaminase|nr:mtaD [Gammaproteobacteria bacterium]
MESIDQIIQAKWLITCEENSTILEDHALVIHEGKIKAILPAVLAKTRYVGRIVENYSTHAILPGLVNAHTHLAMNMFRGLADDLALMNWLNNHIWPAEKKWVSHEFVRDASLFAMAEMIRSGTTCFNDMYFFLEATAEAANIAGMRGAIGITIIDFPTAWAMNTEEYFSKGLAFYESYKDHDRIKITIAPHAIYTVADKNLLRVKEFAEKYDLKINMHIHETADEVNQSVAQTKQRPLHRLQELGLVSPRLIAIHMTQINEEDLEILQSGKPNIVHCPQSNMKLASGACPVGILRAKGLNVALGTDGAASNNDLNMLEEMRSAALMAKHLTLNPESLSAPDILTKATLQGAKALGIDHITGSLSVGKSADFIAVNLEAIETLPVYHPISQIVYSASRSQVTDVWVAGKQLLKNRELTTLQEKELIEKAKYWGERIQKAEY